MAVCLHVYLFDKFNTSKQVHSEINKRPLDSFPGILFLFQHKHVMVKELLQFFIGKVDAELFKPVELDRTRLRNKNQHFYIEHRFVDVPCGCCIHPLFGEDTKGD